MRELVLTESQKGVWLKGTWYCDVSKPYAERRGTRMAGETVSPYTPLPAREVCLVQRSLCLHAADRSSPDEGQSPQRPRAAGRPITSASQALAWPKSGTARGPIGE